MSAFDHSPEPSPINSRFLVDADHDDDHLDEPPFSDGDTASARSIALSSPPRSPRDSTSLGILPPQEPLITPVTLVRQSLSLAGLSKRHTTDTDTSSPASELDGDDRSFFARKYEDGESPLSSIAPSMFDKPLSTPLPPSLPPSATFFVSSPPSSTSFPPSKSDRESVASFGSGSTSYSKKARPESLIIQPTKGPLVLGIALVDFNHLVCLLLSYSLPRP